MPRENNESSHWISEVIQASGKDYFELEDAALAHLDRVSELLLGAIPPSEKVHAAETIREVLHTLMKPPALREPEFATRLQKEIQARDEQIETLKRDIADLHERIALLKTELEEQGRRGSPLPQ